MPPNSAPIKKWGRVRGVPARGKGRTFCNATVGKKRRFRRACQLICGIGAGGCFDVNNRNRSMGVSLVIFMTELLYTRKGKQQDQKGYTHIKCVPVISQRDRYTSIKMG